MDIPTAGEERESAEQDLIQTLNAVADARCRAEAQAIGEQPLMQALRSDDSSCRTLASATARHFLTVLRQAEEKKAEVEETMAVLLREIRVAQRRRRRQFLVGMLGIAGALLIMFLISELTYGHIFVLYWPFALFWGVWASDRTAKTRREAAQTLRKAGDPRAVGVLAVAARDGGDPIVRRAAENALVALLPRVRPRDTIYITSEQMSALLALGYHQDSAMRVALLRALEQIGDERAIPVVYSLMEDGWQPVREQAAQCLPFLQERIRYAQEGKTLLRASSVAPPEGYADELLRPLTTSQTAETAPVEQLLRPVRGD